MYIEFEFSLIQADDQKKQLTMESNLTLIDRICSSTNISKLGFLFLDWFKYWCVNQLYVNQADSLTSENYRFNWMNLLI